MSRLPRFRRIAVLGAVIPAVVLAANISGTSGPDVLEGTPDADRIDGKGSADVMMGLAGNDTFIVGQPDDEVLEAVGDGTDTVLSTVTYTLPIHVENLTLTGTDETRGTGNDLNNVLKGNASDNFLDGLTGSDTMSGFGGNDTYFVDSTGDVVNEAVGEGNDRVHSTVSHTLRVNVEHLQLRGTAAINGAGNSGGNSLRGNSADNRLSGLAGNDTLNGGAGNDRLTGGSGNDKLIAGPGQDTLNFDSTPNTDTNQDVVVDFNPADDVFQLVGAAFTGLSTAGTLPAAQFRIGGSASTAAHRIIYDPNSGILRYDSDGSGPAVSVRFARLVNAAALTNADFVVVDPVVTAVDFDTQIQPIFTSRCTGCHNVSSAPHGLILSEGRSYDLLVNVASKEVPSLKRVKPGDPNNSYLVQKVEGTAAVGGQMPLGRTPLTEAQIDLIRDWISEGADP